MQDSFICEIKMKENKLGVLNNSINCVGANGSVSEEGIRVYNNQGSLLEKVYTGMGEYYIRAWLES